MSTGIVKRPLWGKTDKLTLAENHYIREVKMVYDGFAWDLDIFF